MEKENGDGDAGGKPPPDKLLDAAGLFGASTLTPALRAAEVAACRALCARNTDISTPLSDNTCFIHRLMVCLDAALCGFL
ncbi:unnamed protein product [Plutella xylostella]|uniref:(diamondback moth) hypothetical protein n=1 Tax=Plutella xylostella TaxID=51655 RepID=A0A8S4GAS0_PLUXY|nr:unnamed protein product [Plutella xylostella]